MCAPSLAGHARRPLLPLLLQWMVEVEGICLYWSLMCSAIIMVQVQRVEDGTMFLAIRRWSPHGPPVRLQRPTSTKHGWRVRTWLANSTTSSARRPPHTARKRGAARRVATMR